MISLLKTVVLLAARARPSLGAGHLQGEGDPWNCDWPSSTWREGRFRKSSCPRREGLLWVKKTYIPAAFTSVAQPLEVAFMKAFKCAMARAFRQALPPAGRGAPVQVETGGQDPPVFVAWVSDAIMHMEKEIHLSRVFDRLCQQGRAPILWLHTRPMPGATCSDK